MIANCHHQRCDPTGLVITVFSVAPVLRSWVAVDAPADSDEHHVRSLEAAGVFRTQEDALLPGWHEWETNYQQAGQGGLGADWRATGLSCETTHL